MCDHCLYSYAMNKWNQRTREEVTRDFWNGIWRKSKKNLDNQPLLAIGIMYILFFFVLVHHSLFTIYQVFIPLLNPQSLNLHSPTGHPFWISDAVCNQSQISFFAVNENNKHSTCYWSAQWSDDIMFTNIQCLQSTLWTHSELGHHGRQHYG